jgi:hypothetical protein
MTVTAEHLGLLRDLLFRDPREQVCAVLDGASVPDLPAALLQHDPRHVCLYRGELAPDLAECAPYLVRLEPDAAFTSWILEDGWGEHWGIFALAPQSVPFRELRKHFRTFLMVYDADGQPLYFRFYDPRVLQAYLPTCSEEDARTIFGPVSAYLVETDQGKAALRFAAGSAPPAAETFPFERTSPG